MYFIMGFAAIVGSSSLNAQNTEIVTEEPIASGLKLSGLDPAVSSLSGSKRVSP
jgi:hypothetical protein